MTANEKRSTPSSLDQKILNLDVNKKQITSMKASSTQGTSNSESAMKILAPNSNEEKVDDRLFLTVLRTV